MSMKEWRWAGVSVVASQQWLLFLTLFQIMLGFGMIMPILPSLVLNLGGTSVHMGLILTVWAGAQFIFAPFWGSLSDRVGRKKVLVLSLLSYAFTYSIMGLAPNVWWLIAARLLGGIFSAATLPTAQAFVADLSPPAERSVHMARMGAALSVGFVAGPLVGGVLAPLGTGPLFLTATVLALVDCAAAWILLREPPRTTRTAGPSLSGPRLAWMALHSNQTILYVLAFAATFGSSGMFSMLGFLILERLGLTDQWVFAAFIVQGVASTAIQLLGVRPATRFLGEERAVRISLIAGTFGSVAVILADRFWLLLVAMVLMNGGTAFIRPLISGLLSRKTRLQQGITMGVQTAFDALGRFMGPLVAGILYLYADWLPYLVTAVTYLVFLVWAVLALHPPKRA